MNFILKVILMHISSISSLFLHLLCFINVVIRGLRLTKAYAFMKSTNMHMVGWCLVSESSLFQCSFYIADLFEGENG